MLMIEGNCFVVFFEDEHLLLEELRNDKNVFLKIT